MNQKESTEPINQPSAAEKNKTKSSPILDAFFIGFLVGIIIYSVVMNSWGFLTLIPLVMIYLLLKKSKANKQESK